MPYSKTTWVEGTTGITAARLNNIESGVEVGYNNAILYAASTGSANAYTATLNPAPVALTEGLCIAVKINVDSTSISTINVNGLGAKGIKKANGNDVTNFKSGGIYTLRYNGVNFQLLGEGGEYGTAGVGDVKVGVTFGTENGVATGSFTSDATAVASDIIASKTAYVNGNKVTGTIPDRGAGGTKTPTASNITLLAGRYTTDIVIAGVSVPVANVLTGTTIAGQAGAMINKAGVGQTTTYTNNDANPYIEVNIPVAGYYDTASWVQIANGDMIPTNIKNGVNIFGVMGAANVVDKTFGTGANGALNTAGNVTLSVIANSGIALYQHTTITINAGHTLTVNNPCRGLVLYATGNVVINGTIDMSQKAGLAPNGEILPLLIVDKKFASPNGTANIFGNIAALDNMFKLAIDLQQLKGGTGGAGGAGGTSASWAYPGTSSGGSGGGGRLLHGGFGGGGGGGCHAYYSVNYVGGNGGSIVCAEIGGGQMAATYQDVGRNAVSAQGYNGCGGKGAGYNNVPCGRANGGGSGGTGANSSRGVVNGSADSQYAGGFICIIAGGNITIGSGAIIRANGGNGSAGAEAATYSGGDYCGGGGGGGGSGGGVISLYQAGTLSNAGTLQVNGGTGGTGGSSSNGGVGMTGASGSVGTIHLQKL